MTKEKPREGSLLRIYLGDGMDVLGVPQFRWAHPREYL